MTIINGTTGIDKIQDGSVHDADIDSVSASKLTGVFPDDMATQIQTVKNKYPKGDD